MKNLMNIVIKIVIIAGAAYIFPEYVICKDGKTLILAIIAMIIPGIILSLLTIGAVIGLATLGCTFLAIVSATILSIASGVIQLKVATQYVPGFEINGTMTYIILALLIGVFSIPDNATKKN